MGAEEARLFWVLRIASSSSSHSSQLLRRRSAPPQGARTRGAWDQPLGAPGAGDAGAAGDTCGSSRWQPSPGRQQRKPRQLQSLRPGQPPLLSPPLRSRSLMLLPAPGPADPGGCGFSASQQLFADCSGFQVRRWRGQQPGQARSCHLSAARPCSNPPVRPSGVRAALGLPSGSLVLETETQRRQTGTLSKSRAAGERQIGTTLSCSCLGYTVGDAELGVGRVLEPGKRGKGETNLQPTQVTKCLWPPKKRATTRTGERHTGQPTARGGGRPSQAELSVLCLRTIHGVLGRGHIVSAGHGVQREAPRSEESNQEDIHGKAGPSP